MSTYENPVCPQCKQRKCSINYRRKDGSVAFKNLCDRCRKPLGTNGHNRQKAYYDVAYERKLNLLCEVEKCNFKAVDPCQLDVDHIDGNKQNNDPSNLMVMCANCHRLKTKENRDWAIFV